MSTTFEKLQSVGGSFGCLVMAIYSISQIAAAWIGIDHYWGPFAAGAIIGLCFLFRFSLPLSVASFFGAWTVWEWPWYGALLFAAPGIAFMAIGLTGSIIGSLFDRGR